MRKIMVLMGALACTTQAMAENKPACEAAVVSHGFISYGSTMCSIDWEGRKASFLVRNASRACIGEITMARWKLLFKDGTDKFDNITANKGVIDACNAVKGYSEMFEYNDEKRRQTKGSH